MDKKGLIFVDFHKEVLLMAVLSKKDQVLLSFLPTYTLLFVSTFEQSMRPCALIIETKEFLNGKHMFYGQEIEAFDLSNGLEVEVPKRFPEFVSDYEILQRRLVWR